MCTEKSKSPLMNLCITSNPPLGFVTVVKASQVLFTVGANAGCHTIKAGDDLEISIWHNNNPNGVWTEQPFYQLDFELQHPQLERVYFRARLDKASDTVTCFQFTLKFRIRSGPWQWVKDGCGLQDGNVIFQSRGSSDDLGQYLDGLGLEYSVQPIDADEKLCRSWALASSVPAAQGQKSGQCCRVLGKPLRFLRWFALVRHNETWLSPRQGRCPIALDKDGILLSFLRTDGLHIAVIAVSGVDDILSVFKTSHDGRITVVSRNERERQGTSRLFLSIGTCAHDAIRSVMSAAKSFVQYWAKHNAPKLDAPDEMTADEKRQLVDWYDGFAYCTWNGLGQVLSPGKIQGALHSLEAEGIHVTNLIIDDNWQSLDYSGKDNFYHRWTRFEANPENFPSGLKDLVSEIRMSHPSIQNIAVWHGIFGYWGGMSPEGDIAQKYRMRKFQRQQDVFLGDGDMVTVDGNDVGTFFDDFYRFLVGAGVNAVKADTQSFLDYPKHADDRQNLTGAYQDAWLTAAAKYFRGKSIACMAQIPQVIFYSMARPGLRAIMMRNSDDFFPDEPSSHSWHVFCNAHNAILMQHLNVLPDWDMFQTDHEFANFHAAARCLSGGPIYITDIPGKHNISLIDKMTAKSADGRRIILRPEQIGRTSEIYVAHAETRLLAVQTRHSEASMLGVFNVGSEVITELFHLYRFLNILDDASYIVRGHVSGKLFGPWMVQDVFPMIELTIDERGYEILTAYRVQEIGDTRLAVLGLLGKMTGVAAIKELKYVTIDSQVEVHITLKALGTLGIFISSPTAQLNRVQLSARGIVASRAEMFLAFEDSILTVDLFSLWNKLELSAQSESSYIAIVVSLPVC